MDQHKRAVHMLVEIPLFGGARKTVGRPLSNSPDLRYNLRDALGQMARNLEMLTRRDARKGAVEKMRGKEVSHMKFSYINHRRPSVCISKERKKE